MLAYGVETDNRVFTVITRYPDRDAGDDIFGELEDLLGIRDEAPKNGLGFPSLEAFPFQFGNFFDQPLHQPIVVYGLANPLLPSLGNADLAKLARVALHQVQGLMKLAFGATAIRFAALASAFRQSAAEKPPAGGQLGGAGTKAALGGGEYGAVWSVRHTLYTYSI